jgi:CBS domain-containing protein
MTIARILSIKGSDVVTIQPHRLVSEAISLLAEKRIGAVVVTGADGQVLGILSERDIVRALSAGAKTLQDPVSRYMTARVITCTRDTLVVDAMEEMSDGRFRHLPVVENGRLAGIISIGDVVKHRLAEIQHETEQLRGYITAG